MWHHHRATFQKTKLRFRHPSIPTHQTVDILTGLSEGSHPSLTLSGIFVVDLIHELTAKFSHAVIHSGYHPPNLHTHIHTSTGPGEGQHSSDPEWRPENSLYKRQSQQGERVVEDVNRQTCLVWPGHWSVDQSEQHDFYFQYPRSGNTPSDEIRKKSSGYAIWWRWTNLVGEHRARPDGHLQLPWGCLRHGRFKSSTGMGAGFTDTILKQAGDTGLGEAPEAARPAGPNLRQYVWLLKTPSPTTSPLWSSRILYASLLDTPKGTC